MSVVDSFWRTSKCMLGPRRRSSDVPRGKLFAGRVLGAAEVLGSAHGSPPTSVVDSLGYSAGRGQAHAELGTARAAGKLTQSWVQRGPWASTRRSGHSDGRPSMRERSRRHRGVGTRRGGSIFVFWGEGCTDAKIASLLVVVNLSGGVFE